MRSLFLFLSVAAFGISVSGQGLPIYDSLLSPMPGNVASLGYQATSTSEFGDRIMFSAGSGRKLFTVTQTMSSWACESGNWYQGSCLTTSGATFTHPITLNIYNAGPGNTVGSLIGSVTQTFTIPYRPTADNVNCTGGRWYSAADATCYNGFATNITFNLAGLNVPNEVVYSIAYNTSNYGNAPIGAAACQGTSQGCPYDSLNVGLEGVDVIGTNVDPDDAYIATSWAGYYCDGGAGGVNILRQDAADGACNWTGFQPAVRFNATNVPANKDQCKNDGWRSRTRADGTLFNNQGDCIQYVNTGR